MDARTAGRRMTELLHLASRPVAVTFTATAPAGVPRVDRAGPAGCAYWKQAAEGAVFYTEAADHYNCPVGSFTHGIALPPERARELEDVVGTMVGLHYIRMEEVGALPRRAEPFRLAVYAPLTETPTPPDVVLVRGRARQIMLVAEAARAAGIAGDGAAMGRPACAVIPQAFNTGRTALSLGCCGARAYLDVLTPDVALYAVPGAILDAFTERVAALAKANSILTKFHEIRRRDGESGKKPTIQESLAAMG